MKILFGKSLFTDWNDILNKYGIIEPLNDYKIINYIVAKNNIHLIIPITIDQQIFLNKYKSLIRCNILLNSVETLYVCNNKFNFSVFMNKHFPKYVPTIYNINDIILPAIIKPISKNSGKGCKLILTDKNIKSLHNNKLIKEKLKNNEYIIQEYIHDVDLYSGHFLIINGIIKFEIYCVQKFNGYYISKGKMNNYVKCSIDQSYKNIFFDLFQMLKYNGVACIDFKIKNNDLKIFEINPRFGGTLIHDDELENLINKLCEIYVN